MQNCDFAYCIMFGILVIQFEYIYFIREDVRLCIMFFSINVFLLLCFLIPIEFLCSLLLVVYKGT